MVTIRRATPDDVLAIDDLRRRQSQELGFMPRQAYYDAIAASGQILLVALDPHPVGFLYGGVSRPPQSNDYVATIHQIHTAPSHARQHIASAMLLMFEGWARHSRLHPPATYAKVSVAAVMVDAWAWWAHQGFDYSHTAQRSPTSRILRVLFKPL